MGSIEKIVKVTITRQTKAVSRAGFGTVLFLAEFLIADTTPAFNERIRFYSQASQLIDDGFSPTSAPYLAAVAYFSQPIKPEKIAIGRKKTGVDGTETWTEALTAVLGENPGFYGIAISSRTKAYQEEVAAWTEANKRLFGIGSDDTNILTTGTTDIAYVLKNDALDRSFVIYHPDSDGSSGDPWPEVAWMGNRFPSDPGSSTWAFKTLVGVSAYIISDTEETNAQNKNCNIYSEIGGVNCTQEGKVASGEWIDIIRGIDWLIARLTEDIFSRLVNLPKIPYTDPGISIIEGDIKARVQDAINKGLITNDPAPVINVPKATNVSSSDKIARTLKDVTFVLYLAGAIHKVEINGVVTL